jgi:hypothetical protein
MMAEVPDQGGWLTAMLRPAGVLDETAANRLCAGLSLLALAAKSDVVIVDLAASTVRNPRALARRLLAPARSFEEAGRCLLVIGADADLSTELDREAVPVVTLAADVLPRPARSAPLPAA